MEKHNTTNLIQPMTKGEYRDIFKPSIDELRLKCGKKVSLWRIFRNRRLATYVPLLMATIEEEQKP